VKKTQDTGRGSADRIKVMPSASIMRTRKMNTDNHKTQTLKQYEKKYEQKEPDPKEEKYERYQNGLAR